jgi:hypothetical protein
MQDIAGFHLGVSFWEGKLMDYMAVSPWQGAGGGCVPSRMESKAQNLRSKIYDKVCSQLPVLVGHKS